MTSEERERTLGIGDLAAGNPEHHFSDDWANQGWIRVEDGDEDWGDEDWDDEGDQFLTDGEADCDALSSCGWGTDEDYGCFDGGW